MLIRYSFLLLSSLLILACQSAEEEARDALRAKSMANLQSVEIQADSLRKIDSVKNAAIEKAESAYPDITYRKVRVADKGMLDSIRKTFDYGKSKSPAYKAFVTMNRRVFGSVRVGDSVVLPSEVVDDMRAYSVFPHIYFGAEDVPKLIVVSNAQQSYACYENGELVRFASCNTGTEKKPTLPGRYAVNWKERLRTSSLNDNWKLPFNINFHLFAGNAFHQYYMPGRPASHSCVRQFRDDAQWLYEWIEVGRRNSSGRVERFTGTPIVIIDMFDFTRSKFGPWLDVAGNRAEKLELPEKPMEVEEALIPISQIPGSVRGSLPNRDRYKYAEDTLRARGVLREGVRLTPSIEYTLIKKRRERARQRQQQRRQQQESQPASTPAPSTPSTESE